MYNIRTVIVRALSKACEVEISLEKLEMEWGKAASALYIERERRNSKICFRLVFPQPMLAMRETTLC